MTHQEVLNMHSQNALEAYDAVEDGTPDMRTSLIWLLNVSESWIEQSRLENEPAEAA